MHMEAPGGWDITLTRTHPEQPCDLEQTVRNPNRAQATLPDLDTTAELTMNEIVPLCDGVFEAHRGGLSAYA